MGWNDQIIEEFRANQGKVGGPFSGATLLLLHTKGAKTGSERVNPLMYRVDGDRLVVFGSKGGASTHPDWYYNLLANPGAIVEAGTDTFEVTARIAEGEERDRIWEIQKKQYPAFASYEASTSRKIQVVLLERVS